MRKRKKIFFSHFHFFSHLHSIFSVPAFPSFVLVVVGGGGERERGKCVLTHTNTTSCCVIVGTEQAQEIEKAISWELLHPLPACARNLTSFPSRTRRRRRRRTQHVPDLNTPTPPPQLFLFSHPLCNSLFSFSHG